MNFRFIFFIAVLVAVRNVDSRNSRKFKRATPSEAREILEEVLPNLIELEREAQEASWNYETNITNETQKRKFEAIIKLAKFNEEVKIKMKKFNLSTFEDHDLVRKIELLSAGEGDSLLPQEKYEELTNIIDEMQTNFASTKVPSYKDKKTMVSMEPEIVTIFQLSKDPEELKHYWVEWYNRAGTKSKDAFFKYIQLRNEAAGLSGKLTFRNLDEISIKIFFLQQEWIPVPICGLTPMKMIRSKSKLKK